MCSHLMEMKAEKQNIEYPKTFLIELKTHLYIFTFQSTTTMCDKKRCNEDFEVHAPC